MTTLPADTLVLRAPAAPAPQLMLLFHGYGAAPADLLPLGQRFAQAFPNAFIASVRAPDACEAHAGFQWFPVAGVTEENRPQRIAAAMPRFEAEVRHWQQTAGAGVEVTALIGFSQGAIMALESTQRDAPPLAGRIVALSGRFATPPRLAPPQSTLHFVHGKHDPVIHYGHTVRAAEALIAMGADVTADVIPFLGHAIDDAVADVVLQRLTTHLPKRRWDEAMAAAARLQP